MSSPRTQVREANGGFASPSAPFRPLDEATRNRLLTDVKTVLGRKTLKVFGYGSLLWRPCYPISRQISAHAKGFAARMCVWTVSARGSLKNPGLGLGLVEARSTAYGALIESEPAHNDAALEALWAREMLTGCYRPAWIRVSTVEGEQEALAFVVDAAHLQFAGHLSMAQQAALVDNARGELGSNLEYVEQTAAKLAAEGYPNRELEELLLLIRAKRKTP